MIIIQNSPQMEEKAARIAKRIHVDLLREGRHVYLNTSGCSMYPFVKGGDIMKVMPIKEEDIKLGDIIAIDNEGRGTAWFYVHRVVDIFQANGRRMFLTKGDANREGIDESVPFNRIVGKMISVERNGLKLDFTHPLWERFLNKMIASFSLKHGRGLRRMAPFISLVLEWHWFLLKVARGFRKLDEPLYNAEEFLLICSRTNINKGLISHARELLKKGVDWEFFMKNAMRSGMSFVFCNALKKIDYPAIIPEEFIEALKMAYLRALPGITHHYNETMDILKLFNSREIPAVPLKGPVLAKRLYGDIISRGISTDIDLLIREEDKERARAALKEAGYAFCGIDEKQERFGQNTFRKGDSAAIDLHWQISPIVPSSERAKGFFEGVMLREEDGAAYYEFNEEELLLQLSVHLVDSAHLTSLRYIADVNELLTKYQNTLDWNGLVRKARQWKLSGSLYAALIFSRALFGSYVPNEALKDLKIGIGKRAIIHMLADRKIVLYRDSARRHLIERFLKYLMFQLFEAGSIRDYSAIIFPSKGKMPDKSYAERIFGGVV